MAALTLDQLQPGETGTVVRVAAQGPLRRRMLDMGLTHGVEVRMLRLAPLGDPVEFLVRGYSLSLRRNEAQHVEIQRQGVAL
jgi:ferrous iron transport protein A